MGRNEEDRFVRVLLINDDGLDSPGFFAAIEVCKLMGWDFVFCVPQEPMSGASRGRAVGCKYPWGAVERCGSRGFAISGPLAVCALFGLRSGLVGNVDFCMSGINAGANVGSELTVSGTFCGAVEAAGWVRSLAISRDFDGSIDTPAKDWDWTWVPDAVVRCLHWCLDMDWRLANLNLTSIGRGDALPVLAKVAERPYLRSSFDADLCEVVSVLAGPYLSMEGADDVGTIRLGRNHAFSRIL